jgi:SAM-dependent methyltransferase
MGLRKHTIKYINSMIKKSGFSLNGLNMCELGNQHIKDGYKGFSIAKSYFKSFGVNHVSIDRNGKDGALPLDLNSLIDYKKLGQFDVVTNMGTSEHVENNNCCFENIHNLCNNGGIMIHLLPAIGTKHGLRQYSIQWFEELAVNRRYKIIDLVIKLNNTTDYVWCVLRKCI